VEGRCVFLESDECGLKLNHGLHIQENGEIRSSELTYARHAETVEDEIESGMERIAGRPRSGHLFDVFCTDVVPVALDDPDKCAPLQGALPACPELAVNLNGLLAAQAHWDELNRCG